MMVSRMFLFLVVLVVGLHGALGSELLADNSEYENLLAFDEMLESMKNNSHIEVSSQSKGTSLTLQYANIAIMYHQRNERFKQGGAAESLSYVELALAAQGKVSDSAHADEKLRRSMLAHKALMLKQLGQRKAARDAYDQLIAMYAASPSDPAEVSSSWLSWVSRSPPTSNAMSTQELANALYHKAELLYSLFDEHEEAVALLQQSLAVYPCQYLSFQHLVHAMKATKATSDADWYVVIAQMEAYLLNVKQRASRSAKFKYKYKQPLIQYRVPNPQYNISRVARQDASLSAPGTWMSYLHAWMQDAYTYLAVPSDTAVCTFSHGGADDTNDLYATLGAVRTVSTLPAIQATLHWAMFVAADSLQGDSFCAEKDDVSTREEGAAGAYCPEGARNVSATELAWTYLQRARHFERQRLNEQYERMEYQQALVREQDPYAGTALEAKIPGEIPVQSDEPPPTQADESGGGGGSDADRGNITPRRLPAEERVDAAELERSAAQTRHVASFFEKGYWGSGEDYYTPSAGSIQAELGTAKVQPQHEETGSKSRIPIFIVGFMRSGSTLLESLLEKHSGAHRVPRRLTQSTAEQGGDATDEETAAQKLGFQRGGIWGMGEDSPFVFEMYAMQSETLAAYADLEKQKEALTGAAAGVEAGGQGKKQQKQQDELDATFMRTYKAIIDKRAQSIVAKMQKRFDDFHIPTSNFTRTDGSCAASTTFTSTAATDTGVVFVEEAGEGTCAAEPAPPLHIVDKMLTNYINIGLIHLVFPRAIILHTVRDPLDTLLSCYANRFGDVGVSYTLHLHSLVQRYVHYLEVMQHFRSVLPYYTLPAWPTASSSRGKGESAGGAKAKARRIQALVDVRYEELIANPERVMRHLLENILGVPYVPVAGTLLSNSTTASSEVSPDVDSDAAETSITATTSPARSAAGTENEHPAGTVKVVQTASRMQVREPVYKSAVGRWRKYAAQLNTTLIPALREHLPRLAALGALPYLDPASELAQASVVRGQGKGGKAPKKDSGRCEKNPLDAQGKRRPACVYTNWQLSDTYDYAVMISDLK